MSMISAPGSFHQSLRPSLLSQRSFALFPPARQLYGLLIGPALEVVLVLMLVRVARDEGKRIEPRLIKQRDGLPTTRYLRNRNDELSEPYTLDAVQRRAALSRRRRRPIFIAPKI
jgi:hypothetical protein